MAHASFDLTNYQEAEQAYVKVLSLTKAKDESREKLTENLAASIYKQGEQAQTAGLVDQAVDHFLRVGRMVPNSTIRATAEYDAAAALIQAGNWQRAAPVLENFRTAFPEHELVENATASLAVAYVETGQSIRAASEFEQIADTAATDEAPGSSLPATAATCRETIFGGSTSER